MKKIDYPFTVVSLPKSEGGGYLIEFPDLPGCVSDGDTLEETLINGQEALTCWLAAVKEAGKEVPKPIGSLGGKWVQRVPKSLHARLALQAKKEGVSLNMLVVSMLSENLGGRNVSSSAQQRKH